MIKCILPCFLFKDCQHRCVEIEGVSTCVCNKGFRKHSNGSCVDIDECQEFGKCSQVCRNKIGSHECDCVVGYVKAEDGRSCIPAEPLTSLIFSTLNEVLLKISLPNYFTVP